MTVLITNNLNSNVSAGTAVFTSITEYKANQLVPAATGKYRKVRIGIRPATAGVNLLVNALWMGHQGGANAFSFDGNQVQLKVGGSNSFTITVSGADFNTDPITFNLDTTKPLLFAYDGASNASARDLRRLVGASASNIYFGGGTQGSDASVQNKSGYTLATNTCDMIFQVEGFTLKRSKIAIPVMG